MRGSELIAIGELAGRTGLSISAIRFYEAKGLIRPMRNAGGQRRFLRADIRRLSFVIIAQRLGLTIEDIREELARLPEGRTPTAKDWTAISKKLSVVLDDRIRALSRTRDVLDGCIGCGCLSLKKCALYNPDDRVAAQGAGPRFTL